MFTYVLNFPQGQFLLSNQDANCQYFLPKGSHTAYAIQTKKKETLWDKQVYTIKTGSPDMDTYQLSYEIEDGDFVSARLKTQFEKKSGTLASQGECEKLNADLESGALKVQKTIRPPYVNRAAEFSDGRIVVYAEGLKMAEGGWPISTLFIGKPGSMEEVEIAQAIQGGNSYKLTTKDGILVDFPYSLGGPIRDKPPMYGDEELTYIEDRDMFDLAAFGIEQPAVKPHLDPFFITKSAPKPNS